MGDVFQDNLCSFMEGVCPPLTPANGSKDDAYIKTAGQYINLDGSFSEWINNANTNGCEPNMQFRIRAGQVPGSAAKATRSSRMTNSETYYRRRRAIGRLQGTNQNRWSDHPSSVCLDVFEVSLNLHQHLGGGLSLEQRMQLLHLLAVRQQGGDKFEAPCFYRNLKTIY
jgi:hypothetical protein